MFCKHEWKIITEQTIESFVERMGKNKGVKEFNYPSSALKGSYICILQCVKCGKINKTIEEI